eukprot:6768801-Prymnesium_polylepis.1
MFPLRKIGHQGRPIRAQRCEVRRKPGPQPGVAWPREKRGGPRRAREQEEEQSVEPPFDHIKKVTSTRTLR